MKKIDIVENCIIVAGTGSVGLGQRFCDVIGCAWNADALKATSIDVSRALCQNAVKDFASTQAPTGSYGALVAFPTQHGAHLCEFAVDDFQPELMTERIWYSSMGSAKHITDTFLGFLRGVYWSEPPNLLDGIFAAVWTLDLACEINPGGVHEPVAIAVLEPAGKEGYAARELEDEELAEARQHIDHVKHELNGFRRALQDPDQSEVPDLPRA